MPPKKFKDPPKLKQGRGYLPGPSWQIIFCLLGPFWQIIFYLPVLSWQIILYLPDLPGKKHLIRRNPLERVLATNILFTGTLLEGSQQIIPYLALHFMCMQFIIFKITFYQVII